MQSLEQTKCISCGEACERKVPHKCKNNKAVSLWRHIDIDGDKLIRYLLNQEWQRYCIIIPTYMPPYPSADTVPKCVIGYPKMGANSDVISYLRYSCGPDNAYFWDTVGDNFLSLERAIIALSRAPAPY